MKETNLLIELQKQTDRQNANTLTVRVVRNVV